MSPRPAGAYFWMLVSAASFATMGALSKLLAAQMDWRFLAMIRAILMLVFAGGIAAVAKAPFLFRGTPMLWMRSIVGSISMLCTYYVLTHELPFAEATTLIKSYPIWVAILSWIVLSERPNAKVWVAILLGSGGVVLITQPHFHHASTSVGVGILSALCTAVVMLGLNRLSAIEPRSIVLHFAMISAATMTAVWFATAPRESLGAYGLRSVSMLLAMGLLGTVGQIALTKAFALGDPSQVSVVGLSELIFGVGYDMALWHRSFGLITLAGIALVGAPTAWLLASSRRPRAGLSAPPAASAASEAP